MDTIDQLIKKFSIPGGVALILLGVGVGAYVYKSYLETQNLHLQNKLFQDKLKKKGIKPA